MTIRHFVKCEDCKIVWMIRDNTYNTCRKCNGHNISLFTLRGNLEELEQLDGTKEKEENK